MPELVYDLSKTPLVFFGLTFILIVANFGTITYSTETKNTKVNNFSVNDLNQSHAILKVNNFWNGLDIFSSAVVNESVDSFVSPVNPPDVTIAVGEMHVAQLVHSSIEIWDKTGKSLKKQSLFDFFNIKKTHHITDPKIIYDSTSRKWFATVIDGGITAVLNNGSAYPTCLPDGCRVIMAISQEPDPSRNWTLLAINSTERENFPDQPNIVANKANLILTTTEFNIHDLNPIINTTDFDRYEPESDKGIIKTYPIEKNSDPSTGFPKTYILDKSLLIEGNNDVVTDKNTIPSDDPLYPIPFLNPTRCTSTASPIKEDPLKDLSPIMRIKITDRCNPDDVNFRNVKEISIPKLFPAPVFKQPHVEDTKRSDEIRIYSAIRNDKAVWIALHSACQPLSASNQSCINILKFDNVTIKHQPVGLNYAYNLSEHTQFKLKDIDLYYPAIGVSHDGKMIFMTGFSNSNIFPSLMVSTVVSENSTKYARLATGTGINNSTSYGDYFGSAIDPVDGSVWLSGQYVNSSIPIPSNFPAEEIKRVTNKTWATIIVNVS